MPPRFHKNKEEGIILNKLKLLIETFDDRVFSINSLSTIGNTQRVSVSEGPLWNNLPAVLETMISLKEKGILIFKDIDYKNNHQFKINIILQQENQ
jgi:hypothetical protein